MDNSSIAEDVQPLYQFDWENGPTRTSDEIGDLSQTEFEVTIEDIADLGYNDPDCDVSIIGFD
jgi:hypothetical protein